MTTDDDAAPETLDGADAQGGSGARAVRAPLACDWFPCSVHRRSEDEPVPQGRPHLTSAGRPATVLCGDHDRVVRRDAGGEERALAFCGFCSNVRRGDGQAYSKTIPSIYLTPELTWETRKLGSVIIPPPPILVTRNLGSVIIPPPPNAGRVIIPPPGLGQGAEPAPEPAERNLSAWIGLQ